MMKIETKAGTMLVKDVNGVLTISFEGTDAVVCVYEDSGFKLAMIPYPDCDRPEELYSHDVRVSIPTTNVVEFIKNGGNA
jgi:hypothetical protein